MRVGFKKTIFVSIFSPHLFPLIALIAVIIVGFLIFILDISKSEISHQEKGRG